MKTTFPGGKRVDVEFDGMRIATDQPTSLGGEGDSPAPYDVFLASVAACAGVYALGFCQARNVDTNGMELRQEVKFDPTTHLAVSIELSLTLPSGFPEKWVPAIRRAMENCKVKKTIAHPPEFQIRTEGGAKTATDEETAGASP